MMTQDEFGALVKRAANTGAGSGISPERQALAVRSVVSAMAAALRASPDPSGILGCSAESVMACVNASVVTGIYPGVGSTALAYLVPRKGQLCWSLTHRGMAALAARSQIGVSACPVAIGDHLVVEFGEAVEHHPADPSAYPDSLDQLAGVIVSIRATDIPTLRYWVPASVILRRRQASQTKRSDSPWNTWPMAMAQGAAIREAYARGALPIATYEAHVAMQMDVATETIDVESTSETVDPVATTATTDPTRRPGVPRGARRSAPALPDHAIQREAEQQALDAMTTERQVITVPTGDGFDGEET